MPTNIKKRDEIFNLLGNPDGQKTLDDVVCPLLHKIDGNDICSLDEDLCQGENCSISKGLLKGINGNDSTR